MNPDFIPWSSRNFCSLYVLTNDTFRCYHEYRTSIITPSDDVTSRHDLPLIIVTENIGYYLNK